MLKFLPIMPLWQRFQDENKRGALLFGHNANMHTYVRTCSTYKMHKIR